MGSSNTQGNGHGAATSQKGPGNGRNYYVPQVTPHIVTADYVTLSGTTKTVNFPKSLSGDKAKFAVVVTSDSATACYVSARTNDSDGNFSGFTITGGSGAHVSYVVVNNGLGLDF